jgi:SAM-dependent methyltransferase
MPNWFKPGLPPHHTELAMIGAKPGDRVAMLGAFADLAAALALVTGLNGQTVVVGEDAAARTAVEGAAARAGALVDFEQAALDAPPLEEGRFDIAVVAVALTGRAEQERAAIVHASARLLRPGGRLVIVDGRKAGGMLGFGRTQPRLDPPAALAMLERAGLRANRQLADTEGVAFYEARKP